MLSQRIVELLPAIGELPLEEQDRIAIDLYAELVDARFRFHLESGVPMPTLEKIIREAEESEARGESVSMDDWLAGGNL